MKTILIIILFLTVGKGSAQDNSRNIKDTIFVIFDYKSMPNLGMSRSYNLDKKEVFSVWNKENDSVIFIGKENVQFKRAYLKKKKEKTFLISKLIASGVFNYLRLVENKIIFIIDSDAASRKVKMIKIDEAIFSERPQECF